jgi:elongation factor Ts
LLLKSKIFSKKLDPFFVYRYSITTLFSIFFPMSIDPKTIQELRSLTGISIAKCKSALEEADGDINAAIDHLRKQGESAAAKRSDRATPEGAVLSYIHDHKIGVLIQLGCETDFVAKNEDFQKLGMDIAMHIVASSPLYLSPEDISEEVKAKEIEIYKEQLKDSNKPEEIMNKIMDGKIKKFTEENALLTQPFVKDSDMTIEQLLKDATLKMGEKIVVVDFKRMSI